MEVTRKQSDSLPSALYVVATPIGNLGDITYRAVDVLAEVDLIACEDRRVTAKLLTAFGIQSPTLTYNDHNAARVRPGLIERLQKGESVALVSDAGTPLIADPGYKLIQDCIAHKIEVVAVPGANAAVAALTASGLPPDVFQFVGFLPNKATARRRRLGELATVDATLIFYESPRRLAACLRDLANILGDRPAAVTRELTKLHEEVVRNSLSVLADRYATLPTPKGEVVIVVGPPADDARPSDQDVDALLREALATHSLRDAAAAVSAATGLPRRDVYARAVALKSADKT